MNAYLRVVGFVRPYWVSLSAAAICMVIYSVASGATVWVALPFLQTLFSANQTESAQIAPVAVATRVEQQTGLTAVREWLKERTNDLITRPNRQDTLKRLCFIILVVLLVKNMSGYFQSYLMAHAENGVIRDLRDELYTHLHRLSLSYFQRERTGELISRLTYDVLKINGTVSAAFGTLIKEPLLVLMHLAIMLILSWKLTVASLTLLPLSVLAITTVGRRLRKSSAVSQEAMADLTSTIQETVAGIRVVKAFSMEAFEIGKFRRQTQAYFETLLRLTRLHNLASPVTELLGGIVGLAILWYGGSQALEGELLAPEDFLTFFLALFSMLKPLKELGQVNNRIQEGVAAADRVFSIMDTVPEIVDAPEAHPLTKFRDTIRFRKVSFQYLEGREALKDIDLEVRKGEIVAIVGPSGGGKSTLVDLLTRFYDPISGCIEIDGHDIKTVTLSSLRERMGIVTQDVILFNDTINANIAYGLADSDPARIRQAAVAANADEFIRKLPLGYETSIGERGVRLSGGQRQRLAIARAILKDPEILIFDEATSALDTESELLVQGAIDHLMQGRTTFVIAHRLSTVQHAQKIVVIDQGRIVQMGDHVSLISEEGPYRKLYALQFREA